MADYRIAAPRPGVAPARTVADLAAGPLDARRALAPVGADEAEAAYRLHRAAMQPSLPEPWVEPERRADFDKLVDRVPSFFIVVDASRAGYLQVMARSRVLHVVNIGFDPVWQGAGHGSALMGWLQRQALTRGCGLHLKAYHSNPRALAFYERHGFRQSARNARHVWLDWSPAARG